MSILVDKYELRECLKKGVVTVVFEKVNGDVRTMRCTLSDLYIPQVPEEGPKMLSEYDGQVPKPTRQLNDDVQPVWDIDAQAWRSFRYDSLTYILRE
jgi:hypothetical protein